MGCLSSKPKPKLSEEVVPNKKVFNHPDEHPNTNPKVKDNSKSKHSKSNKKKKKKKSKSKKSKKDKDYDLDEMDPNRVEHSSSGHSISDGTSTLESNHFRSRPQRPRERTGFE